MMKTTLLKVNDELKHYIAVPRLYKSPPDSLDIPKPPTAWLSMIEKDNNDNNNDKNKDDGDQDICNTLDYNENDGDSGKNIGSGD